MSSAGGGHALIIADGCDTEAWRAPACAGRTVAHVRIPTATNEPSTIIRGNTTQRLETIGVCLVGALALGCMTVWSLTSVPSTPTSGDAALIGLFGFLVFSVLFARAIGSAVVVTNHGLSMLGLLTTRRIEWSDIDRLDMEAGSADRRCSLS